MCSHNRTPIRATKTTQCFSIPQCDEPPKDTAEEILTRHGSVCSRICLCITQKQAKLFYGVRRHDSDFLWDTGAGWGGWASGMLGMFQFLPGCWSHSVLTVKVIKLALHHLCTLYVCFNRVKLKPTFFYRNLLHTKKPAPSFFMLQQSIHFLLHLLSSKLRKECDCYVKSCTLITGTRGLNLEDSWVRTSPSNCWCFRTFLIFMILTMAAYATR